MSREGVAGAVYGTVLITSSATFPQALAADAGPLPLLCMAGIVLCTLWSSRPLFGWIYAAIPEITVIWTVLSLMAGVASYEYTPSPEEPPVHRLMFEYLEGHTVIAALFSGAFVGASFGYLFGETAEFMERREQPHTPHKQPRG